MPAGAANQARLGGLPRLRRLGTDLGGGSQYIQAMMTSARPVVNELRLVVRVRLFFSMLDGGGKDLPPGEGEEEMEAASPDYTPSSPLRGTASADYTPSTPPWRAASPDYAPSTHPQRAASPDYTRLTPPWRAASPDHTPATPLRRALSPNHTPSTPPHQAVLLYYTQETPPHGAPHRTAHRIAELHAVVPCSRSRLDGLHSIDASGPRHITRLHSGKSSTSCGVSALQPQHGDPVACAVQCRVWHVLAGAPPPPVHEERLRQRLLLESGGLGHRRPASPCLEFFGEILLF
uniref:Uncharacterized protein n=1 Tax=Oryza brachyantha TaxID=4533 RepID=J3N1S4_ORYBR